MGMDQDHGPSGPERLKTALGWVAFMSGALAISVEVFLHRSRSFGERYVGMQAAAVIVIVPLYSMFWEGYDLMPLMRFLGAFLLMCFLVRLGGLVRRRRDGQGVHSRYTGYPRLMRLMPRADERRVKGALEPLLVFFAGIFASPTSEPLGGYLILTSVGLAVSVQLSVGYERQRVIDMNDAYLEQRYVAERFREMRRN